MRVLEDLLERNQGRASDQPLSGHGRVYDVADGLLRDFGLRITPEINPEAVQRQSIEELIARPVRARRIRG